QKSTELAATKTPAFQLTKKEASKVSAIVTEHIGRGAVEIEDVAKVIEEKGWNPSLVQSEIENVVGQGKADAVMAFLYNFYNVYLPRYKKEGQLDYMETAPNFIQYLSEEPFSKYAKLGWASFMIMVNHPVMSNDAGGFINGAVISRNKAMEDVYSKQDYLSEIQGGQNLLLEFIGYKCISEIPRGKQLELVSLLDEATTKHIGKNKLASDYRMKEFAGPEDFETEFWKMGNFKVPLGLRGMEINFDYYKSGQQIKMPENMTLLYFALQKMGEVPQTWKDNLMPLDDLIKILEANFAYHMIQDATTKTGKQPFDIYMKHATKDLQIVEKGSVKYVQLGTLQEAWDFDQKKM
ncbi:MAG: hypothetical protein WC717_06695, partial [Candidatus Micrarchaeia archaeon]